MSTTEIVVATFEEPSRTWQAFSEIKNLAAQRKVQLEALAIVRKAADGHMETPEMVNTNVRGGTTGGLIGALVGILGGPLGVLLGWSAGAIVGSLRDFNEVKGDISLLQRLSEGMNPGHVALIGEINTQSVDEVRKVVFHLQGEFLRRPASEIEDEIAKANAAQHAASEEAKRTFGSDI